MMRSSVTFIFSALLITGCSAPLTPAMSEYTILPSVHPTQTKKMLPYTLTLSVASSKALPSLSSKNLYYLREGGESGAYLYSRWSDTPSLLIQNALISSLQEKALFTSLLPATSSAHADWVLESDLSAFYHRLSKKSNSEGFIDITYRLINVSTKLPIASKRFIVTVPAATNDAKGGVDALAQGTQELCEQVTTWITTLEKEKQ
jgi:cholesterol transport system auxiliary component